MFNLTSKDHQALFYVEKEAYSGVRKIAQKVMADIALIFDNKPTETSDKSELASTAIIYGTIQHSPILDQLEKNKQIDLTKVRGKREVFLIQTVKEPIPGVENALVIAGSDKRGTIYGLFHLSELLGVSPLVNWSNVKPEKKTQFILEEAFQYVSKEPSVRFRGFFINDEWPAFGNWAMERFGGFNAEMYAHVFELLLRLKGNYLWPAMWSARFNDEGPGLQSVELADELGVVIGASHHEPCLRYGEEYKYLRGKDSIYGDAWNFITNRQGITKFWEDGLKRCGQFENVITIGMRGEQDTSIMGKDATLQDNIDLLRDVIETQHQLIEEHVDSNLAEVPRMLALYKEVEPFYYGDENAKGLIETDLLDDVILMLCDDNHGNLRTLPTEEMRKHKGGYGMYYHFDYHGGPISYEWVNSSYLPKIWEQMSMAYDYGVRDLWVVNVGDIATQEFPLSYFLDLAYDFDKWGTNAINQTDVYTRQWIRKQFTGKFTEESLEKAEALINGYTKIAHRRRPEHVNAHVYHPVHNEEADDLLAMIDDLLEIAEDLYQKVDASDFSAFFSLLYYPAVANLNVHKLWLWTTKNHDAAEKGKLAANSYAEKIKECLDRDKALVEEYHTIDDGKWYGMGLSEHIGFVNWNEDESQYPIAMHVFPKNKERLLVEITGTGEQSEGSLWHTHHLHLKDFLQYDKTSASFTISTLSDRETSFTITCEEDWLHLSTLEGILDAKNHTVRIEVTVDREKILEETEGNIYVKTPTGMCTIHVPVRPMYLDKLPDYTFVDTLGYISIEAEHFVSNKASVANSGEHHQFEVIHGYGKTLSAIKAFPTTATYLKPSDAPYVDYSFVVSKAGDYTVQLYMQPSNPVAYDTTIYCHLQLNDAQPEKVLLLPKHYRVDDKDWAVGVLNHIRIKEVQVACRKGQNTLRIYAGSPGFVLEKIVLYPLGKEPLQSYLGPKETYYTGKVY